MLYEFHFSQKAIAVQSEDLNCSAMKFYRVLTTLTVGSLTFNICDKSRTLSMSSVRNSPPTDKEEHLT